MRTMNFMKIGALMTMSACLPYSGDSLVDRNKDGVADASQGNVRGVDTVTLEAPSSPNATIWGVLVNGVSGEAIADQDVTIFTAKGSSLTATTDATGAFSIEGVAQGDYLLTAAREGFIGARWFGNVQINGNIDNQSKNIGRVYMLPADGTLSVTVIGEDGATINNASIIVRVITVGNPGADYQDFRATTNGNGIAQVNNVPSFGGAGGVIAMNTPVVQVIVPGVDSTVPADGYYEYGGKVQELLLSDIAQLNNAAVVTLPLNGTGELRLVSTNLVRASAGLASAPLVSGSGPFVFVFSQPVDAGSVALSFINAFTKNGRANSEPSTAGERPAIDAFEINTKPANGTPSATVALDPSGTILYVSPATAIPAGYEFRVTGSVARARRSNSGLSNTVVFSPEEIGGYALPSEPALSIPRVYLEQGGNGFGTVTLVLSRVVRGYVPAAAPPYIFVCSDDDLNNSGSRTDSNGVLDPGECPNSEGYSYSRASANRLIKATLRGGGLQPGTGQFWQFSTGGNASAFFSGSRTSARLRVVVPLVDNQVWVDGTTAAFPDGSAIGYSFVAGADITVAPAVSANVIYDLTPSNFLF